MYGPIVMDLRITWWKGCFLPLWSLLLAFLSTHASPSLAFRLLCALRKAPFNSNALWYRNTILKYMFVYKYSCIHSCRMK